ncbi:Ni,Fe-hydrogenase I cytochrome b subunit [Mucilaginibacter yixingensis]|uniref:Ni,Fe-hydrogenase I cytochrome b subunit n=1 Tax=Mucilaginibacter yixingensis TaxID=1295612 RepID=A0A2T5JGD3_9SPHI|nr:cytochrome b/b6 domain-containing protein [Mucilaginibacter yixingensis]PTR01426.1 Ni,Fe-hydrogenase I cytochrome b subunit [Mucilaginibacter yixingensis]
MTAITPIRTDIDHPQRTKRYSSSLRLWHWLNAVVITGSLLTVLVNSTILKSKTATQAVKSALAEKKVTVDDGQAKAVVHQLRDTVWEWHTYIGYTLAALFLFRLIMEFFQLADQKLTHKISKAYHQFFIVKKQRELSRHEFWVKTLYAVFYLLLLITVITGLDLAFEDQIPALKSFHFLKQVHAFNMYLIIAFIIVHLVGVCLAERKERDKGIVSDMINGGNA